MTSKSSQEVNHQPQTKSPIGTLSYYLNVVRSVGEFMRGQLNLVTGVPIQTLDNLGNLLNGLDRRSRPSIPKSQSPNNPTLPFPKGSPQNPEIEI